MRLINTVGWFTLFIPLFLAGCGSDSASGGDKSAPAGSGTPPPVTSHPDSDVLPNEPTVGVEVPVHTDVVQKVCVACHTNTGAARNAALQFSADASATLQTANLAALDNYVFSRGGRWLLDKARGLHHHGGGQQVAPGSSTYETLVDYLEMLTGESYRADSYEQASYSIEPAATTYRRASLILTGEVPSAKKMVSIVGSTEADLRAEILELMNGEKFREFLKRGANDQLLVRGINKDLGLTTSLSHYYPEFQQRYDGLGRKDVSYARAVMRELAEAPLELIAYVVENDRPYTEILTANYTMVSGETAQIFKTGAQPQPDQFVPASNRGQHVSGTVRAYASYDWNSSTPVSIPHAGILTDLAYLRQYQTTTTNRNRARSRWTFMHFLGVDIERSADIVLSRDALQNEHNPTLNNPACTACHIVMDPVAGAFQNFGRDGIYRRSGFGLDSLPYAYRTSRLYETGDTWYADMLPPGFQGQPLADSEATLQQLAQHIVQDPRFAQGAVKFWWPAIFGEPLLGDNLSKAQNDAKIATLADLSAKFTQSNFNLKALLTDMLMSDWFRIAQLYEAEADDAVAIYTGGRRLLTPEELFAKTASLTGVEDETLLGQLNLVYGGIDSHYYDQRFRDVNSVMSRVAERHALQNACTIVAAEFNTEPTERRLFTLVDRIDLPGSGYSKNLILSDAKTKVLRDTFAVEKSTGQAIKYSLHQFIHAHEGFSPNDVYLETLEIRKPDGSILVSGDVGELYQNHAWITGTPVAGLSPYKIRRRRSLELAIPVEMSGEYVIEVSLRAKTAGNHVDIIAAPAVVSANADDPATVKIRQQIAKLVERMHGEVLLHNSPKIIAYTNLFMELRANAEKRGADATLLESDLRCEYNHAELSDVLWSVDPVHALSAWRGVITALMTDYSYIFE